MEEKVGFEPTGIVSLTPKAIPYKSILLFKYSKLSKSRVRRVLPVIPVIPRLSQESPRKVLFLGEPLSRHHTAIRPP